MGTDMPATPAMTDAMQPTQAAERIAAVDVLRGFALFGILLVNMQFFSGPFYLMFLGERTWTGTADRVAETAIMFFAQGKFYSLFSFLFGLGFAIILLRAQSRGQSGVRLYARRLLVLLGIGMVHALGIWFGDILMTYAVFGFVLLLFRKARPGTLLIWALVLVLLPPALTFAGAAYGSTPEGAKDMAEQAAEQRELFGRLNEDSLRAYGSGTLGDIFRQRATDVGVYWSFVFFFAPSVVGMFLLGLWAGKTGLFEDAASKLGFFRKVQRWGLGVGIVGNAAMVWAMQAGSPAAPTWEMAWGQLGGAFGMPAFMAFYASSLVLLWHDPRWRPRLQPLGTLGRMALSNYLFQSIVATTIFYSYGLGLYGRVGPALGVLFVVSIYAAQFPLSAWWLARFQFGPAEWLWRSLTYGKAQPMRLQKGQAEGA